MAIKKKGPKEKKGSGTITSIGALIQKWKLNNPLLAESIDMPKGTFKNKLNDNLPTYHLSDQQEQALLDVLGRMANDIVELIAFKASGKLETVEVHDVPAVKPPVKKAAPKKALPVKGKKK